MQIVRRRGRACQAWSRRAAECMVIGEHALKRLEASMTRRLAGVSSCSTAWMASALYSCAQRAAAKHL